MQDYINCFSCNTKVQIETIQHFYGNGVCEKCYKNFQKILEAIESDIDPYTLSLTDEQKEARNRVARGRLVDDITFVKCNMQKQLFEELYSSELNCATSRGNDSVYLFNCDVETRIYFDKKCGIPYMQFWDASQFAFHPSTCRAPSKKYPISFLEFKLLAKEISNTYYEKIKDIDVFNWREYIDIIDLIRYII